MKGPLLLSKILAIDAASVSCSAAVMVDDKITASQFINNGLTHSQTLLCAVENVIKLSGIEIKELDKIALTVGPGSFTGIKIGVATVKGLAFANNIECVAVSSLEAAAYNGIFHKGTICAVMDARRNQFYNALFTSENGILKRLCPDRRIEKSELIKELDENTLIVGDGTKLLEDRNFVFSPPSERYIMAKNILSLVQSGGSVSVNHENLVPVYLRAPQAERERLENTKETLQ